MIVRRRTLADGLISAAENALKTLATPAQAERPSPAETQPESSLSDAERRHSASLMRINHTGEVCAQALYQGQALTARLEQVRAEMDKAAQEEVDHLAWCEQRLSELGSRTSVLNPVFYALSFGIGATAGLISDRISLGFVAATEENVCAHLVDHKERISSKDGKSLAVIEKMIEDENRHGEAALNAGGAVFPKPVKQLMVQSAKLMTKSTALI